ncbi:MoaD/ThiS family protein [Enterococcus sp. AZ109]|uniref:MoaD/ThiS family protein n=1 Tax=Enterococcus sp. AZ109 TaxID=2774634 RepID=UPI003F1F7DC9
MSHSVKLFAYLAEQLGSQVTIELPELVTKQTIVALLIEQFPKSKNEISGCNVAINQSFINQECFNVEEINEIALIPPVSGG